MTHPAQNHWLGWALALSALSVVFIALGASVGSAGFDNLWQALGGADAQGRSSEAALAWQIVWDIRLPRSVGAWTAGALLGLAGALAQGLFRNPLADPYLLGSASGAALGVAAALAVTGSGAGVFAGAGLGTNLEAATGQVLVSAWSVWWQRLGITGAAFAGAVLAVFLTLGLARGVQHSLRLLLAGVVVGVVLAALTQLVLLYSPAALQAMQAFILGSTALVDWTASVLMLTVWLMCVALAWALSRVLDGLALGEATALSLGLPLAPVRSALVAVLALATGTAVAHTGLIAFVGLAAPHLVRSALRVTHGPFLLLSSLAGAVLLTLADLLARWLIAPLELPVGVLTAVLGGMYLLWLMHRQPAAGGVS